MNSKVSPPAISKPGLPRALIVALLSGVLAVTLLASCSGPPSKGEIARLCLAQLKEDFLDETIPVVRFLGERSLSALWKLGETAEVKGIRQISQSEVLAKFEVQITYTREVSTNIFGIRAGKKGETFTSEEECTLTRFDTGWRTQKIVKPK